MQPTTAPLATPQARGRLAAALTAATRAVTPGATSPSAKATMVRSDPAESDDEQAVEATVLRSELTLFVRLLALLCGAGASAGWAVACLLRWPDLAQFAANNQIERALRYRMISCVLGGVVVGALVAIAVALLRRAPRSMRGAYDTARRLAPFYWVGAVPILVNRRVWTNRDTDFLLLTAVFSLGLWAAIKIAQQCPRLAIERQVSSWFGPVGSGLWSALPGMVRRHWAMAALVATLGAVAYAVARMSLRGAADLSHEKELLAHLSGGGLPFSFRPAQGQRLEPHANFISYLLAAAFYLVPRMDTALVVHAVLVVGAALPLYLLTKRQLGPGPALVVSLAYLLSPTLRGAHQYKSYDLLVGVGFFWLAWDGFTTRRDIRALAATVLALAAGEQVALWLVVLGVYLVLSRTRPWAGFFLAAAAGAYFVVFTSYVLPGYGGRDLLWAGSKSLASTAASVLTSPVNVLSTLADTCSLADWLKLLVPLALLPLRSPFAMLLLMPGLLFVLMTRDACPGSSPDAYTATWIALLFVGVALALARFRRDTRGRVHPHVGAIIALLYASVISSTQFGGLLR